MAAGERRGPSAKAGYVTVADDFSGFVDESHGAKSVAGQGTLALSHIRVVAGSDVLQNVRWDNSTACLGTIMHG